MGIDYGKKRVGIAVTDTLKIISSALQTVRSDEIIPFLEGYLKEEEVDCLIVGMPLGLDGEPTDATHLVLKFLKELRKAFPDMQIETVDEQFSSRRAKEIIFQSGAKKKKRRDKALVDKVSAAIILQDYMDGLN